ncbi:hypothetical protein WR25_15177 isoform B [Diploscapter pachys]|uniref:GDP-fucose pyrophosphorylase domain-containing protein n=1 Tax=Diploscapter pachys TaxID=2018661 RepID=A0A2A2KNZ9_9BILA|nr:hypothetical protein WR25_15177 isoform B [Diploscapter pachys]
MWDIVVLTAGNVKQKADFELYLKSLDLSQYAGEVTVIADDLEGVKIGSGGSTVHVIWNLYKKYGGNLVAKRILLIHSGGLSTRMPHISARGKIFTQLPGSKTMLEAKLASYRELSTAIRAGVVITASDVIEDIAKNHGVYVMDPRGHLRTVLQKPDEDALQTYFGQHLPQKFLTDSFYWISWDIALKLKDLARKNMNFEVCCYGDFMFCLGTCPNEDYIFEGTNQARRTLRQIICNVLKGSAAKVVNMGEDSFFHFGTATEFLDHIDKNSIFYQKFLGTLIENRFANSSIQNLTVTFKFLNYFETKH